MGDQNTVTVADLENKIYRLAFFMTSSKILARELVLWTYRDAGSSATLHELLRSFRAFYFSNFCADIFSSFLSVRCACDLDVKNDSSGRYYDDIKMTVLFAEMFGLTHHEISEINGIDATTLKLWLWWGRKAFSS